MKTWIAGCSLIMFTGCTVDTQQSVTQLILDGVSLAIVTFFGTV